MQNSVDVEVIKDVAEVCILSRTGKWNQPCPFTWTNLVFACSDVEKSQET